MKFHPVPGERPQGISGEVDPTGNSGSNISPQSTNPCEDKPFKI